MRQRNTESNSSEETKRSIKDEIDIVKMGVGITKLKKAVKGAIVIGCENVVQANKLMDNVTKQLKKKYGTGADEEKVED